MPKVMVVPETEDYEFHVSHENLVWITKNLGVPQLETHDARYIAPFWLKGTAGVTRIYHVLEVTDTEDSTEIALGNSFVLPNAWDSVGQRRRFEYHELQEFGFVEAWPGMLVRI